MRNEEVDYGNRKEKVMLEPQGHPIAGEALRAQGPQVNELRSRAWVGTGLFGRARVGFLELQNGRVRFVTNGGEKVFDSPLGEVKGEFPKLTLGGGAKLSVTGRRYYVSFYPPGSQSIVAGVTAIKAWKRWKDALTSS
jgi:hypothetical protein